MCHIDLYHYPLFHIIVNTYWKDNIFDNNPLHFNVNQPLNAHEKNIFSQYNLKIQNHSEIINVLKTITKEIFGGFITIETELSDDILSVKINQTKYVELILFKNRDLYVNETLERIKNNLGSDLCYFNAIHKRNKIKDFF